MFHNSLPRKAGQSVSAGELGKKSKRNDQFGICLAKNWQLASMIIQGQCIGTRFALQLKRTALQQ
jgi:hypothetical protein